jgi:8-oxo-dGTP diphosphatase
MRNLLARIYRAIPRPLIRMVLWAVNPKFNVGAVGLFFTPDGRVLVLKHVYRHSYPWGLPGGYLARGETAEAGILRELLEETALTAVIERTLCVEDVDAWQREVVFVGRVDPAQTLRLNHEIETAAYVAVDQLPADMLPRHARLVQRYVSSISAR